jgi:hypothetical protein
MGVNYLPRQDYLRPDYRLPASDASYRTIQEGAALAAQDQKLKELLEKKTPFWKRT